MYSIKILPVSDKRGRIHPLRLFEDSGFSILYIMTKDQQRDEFASRAMQAQLSNEFRLQRLRATHDGDTDDIIEEIALLAYHMADTMMSVRNMQP